VIIWINGAFCAGKPTLVAVAARQPAGTLMLRSDMLTPAELADEVPTRPQGQIITDRITG
jgi:hypothetical protein